MSLKTKGSLGSMEALACDLASLDKPVRVSASWELGCTLTLLLTRGGLVGWDQSRRQNFSPVPRLTCLLVAGLPGLPTLGVPGQRGQLLCLAHAFSPSTSHRLTLGHSAGTARHESSFQSAPIS